MVKKGYGKPAEQNLTDEQYEYYADQKFMTEQQAMQQEVFTRIPGIITFLLQYELKPLLRILGSIGIMAAMWFFLGWDVVASAIAVFGVAAAIGYLVMAKSQEGDSTLFIESKLAGQKIEPGDHSPYTQTFFTTETRFAGWLVPNPLIKKQLFTIPGDPSNGMMPWASNIIFCDLFDRLNRTCVMPQDPDVANIGMMTNMNPLLSEKMNETGTIIKQDKETEALIKAMFAMGNISEREAADALKPIKIRQKAFMSPNRASRRDIFFELQKAIPELRKKNNVLSTNIFTLADFLAAHGIYQTVNRVMPEEIRKGHNKIYDLFGLPQVQKTGESAEGA